MSIISLCYWIGEILCDSGYASPQVDIIVLSPAYPKLLYDKKLYLAGGVVAAFECKTTLQAHHIKDAVETASKIRENLPNYYGSPYKELNSSIVFGLLAHSHSWKDKNSKPVENIEKTLWESDLRFEDHPKKQIDFITVSDLGTWQAMKMAYIPGTGPATSFGAFIKNTQNQKEYFTPIGVLLSGLFMKLSWRFPDMRELNSYFTKTNISGNGVGKMRKWPMDIYSNEVRQLLPSFVQKDNTSEWFHIF